MTALKRLFGRDDKFYNLLEASAEEAKHSATILAGIMPQLGNDAAFQEGVEQLTQSRRKHKRITQEITAELCKTFVTPLEREDIEALSNSLSKVPKGVEKISERLFICPLTSHADSLSKQVAMLEKAAATVLLMVRALRKRPHVEEIQDDYAILQSIEGDADKFMIALLQELFRGEAPPKDAIFLKDIY